MKKIMALCLALLMLATLCSCIAIGSEHETKAIVDSTEDQKETTGDKNGSTTDSEKQEPEEPTISEQVCFEYMGIKVTAKSMVNDSIWGTGIKLLIENNATKTYSIRIEEVIVNNCMVSSLFSSEVSAGKKANETVYLSTDDLKAAGIEHIGQIEIYFYITDEEYETVYRSECVTIKTSLFDKMDTTPDASGHELFNQGGIRIVGKYVDEDSFWGSSVLLCIENKTGKNITVSCEEMSVNGFMVTPFFVSTVYSGKYAVDELTLLSSDLEENGITSIEEIEISFHIYDSTTYDTIVDTPSVSFSVK